MAGLLHSEKMDKIENLLKDAFDFDKEVVYFPVRHHSPACSYHLKKVIEEYKPEAILIEGPSNTNELIPIICNEETKPPVSIYYSYNDKDGVLGEKNKRFTCNYPFLNYSPEYNAIIEGNKKGINVEFIDLPYEEILMNSHEDYIENETEARVDYDYDSLVSKSKFIEVTCKKLNCRTLHEFWEKIYEINGLYMETSEFIKGILSYCYFSRLSYTDEELENEGCIQRELYMKKNIEKAKSKYNKILVVSGGFHTWGLINLNSTYNPSKKVNASQSSAYLIPFSFEESDRVNGYKSGMPYVAYYDKVWTNLNENLCGAYDKATLEFIARCGNELRKSGEGISLSDSIEAINMSRGLSSMRDKKEPGAYELIEGVRASFIKGEYSKYNNKPLDILLKLTTGNSVGHVPFHEHIPPIILDFRESCKKLKLDITTSLKKEKILNIHSTKLHKKISVFFHRMNFLNTDFSIKIKGPDYVNRSHINLKREIWEYKWTSLVEGALIEKSIYGSTVESACREILLCKLKKLNEHSIEAAKILVFSILMDINDLNNFIIHEVKRCIDNDGEFKSLIGAANAISILLSQNYLMDGKNEETLLCLIEQAINRGIYMINTLGSIGKEYENSIIEHLKTIYSIIVKNNWITHKDCFEDQLISLIYEHDCNDALKGAALGILLGFNKVSKNEVMKECNSYFFAIGEKRVQCANFLKGLFSTSKDIVLVDEHMIHSLDKLFKELSYEEFMMVLPELRLAFSFFTPMEISKIGENVGKIYGKNELHIISEIHVDENIISICKKANDLAIEELFNLGIYTN